MPFSRITCTVQRGIAAVRLHASVGGCTIDETMAAELSECCADLAASDDIRVVTITGSGNEFAVGRMAPPAGIGAPERMDWFRGMGVASAVPGLPMPVVAVLNGDAMAHGLELALGADLRIASDHIALGLGDAQRDGFPYDGGTQRLPRLVGPATARDMLLTGRVMNAEEALQSGLVNRVVPGEQLEEAADELAATIAAAAPLAARYAKEAVGASGDLTLHQGLKMEADLSILLHSTDDRAEGLLSFAQRRAPQFTGS